MERAEVYIDRIIFPIPPETITYTNPDRTEELYTVNGDTVTVQKFEGAKQIQMEMRIPTSQNNTVFKPLYPPQVYETYLEKLKRAKKSCVITILRPNGQDTSREMVLRDWQEVEQSPLDMTISLTFSDYTEGYAYEVDPNTRQIIRRRRY